RPYTQDLIEQFAPHCEVQCLGSRYLVELAEAYIGGDDVSDALFEHLNSWLMQHPKMQMIVLGCTHFPLLRVPLEVLWPNIQWLDSGQAVAAQAKRVYDINHPTSAHLNRQTHAPLHLFWTGSKEPLGVVQFLSKIGLVQTKQAFTF
ncbi:MAG: hypothetical protein P1U57_13390, partial [Oleibacter sp.]|nr:hypothetical protein [Thalassolituus sp.]